VPDGGGEGQDALQDPDGDAVDGSPAVLLEVELALRVSLTDSMTWRSGLKYWRPPGSGSPLRAGRSSLTRAAASAASKSRP
jgi:hypothetical protein